MNIHLVRHPRVQVAKDICYGSSDVAVASEELEQLLRVLLTSLPDAARLFSSPLRRCAELATRYAAARGNNALHLDARLAEMHFGSWEMRSWADIPRAEVDAWATQPIEYKPGGGESVLEMLKRVQAFTEELLAAGQDCIVFCHAGTIRLMLACQQGGSPQEIALRATVQGHRIAYGEVIVLQDNARP